MRDRRIQRALHKMQQAQRRQQNPEEQIDRRNCYGYKDLTAYNAVRRIRTRGRSNIVLK